MNVISCLIKRQSTIDNLKYHSIFPCFVLVKFDIKVPEYNSYITENDSYMCITAILQRRRNDDKRRQCLS